MSKFQEWYREAHAKSRSEENTESFSIQQQDTSFIDEDLANVKKRKIKTIESDVDKLRKMAFNIVEEDTNNTSSTLRTSYRASTDTITTDSILTQNIPTSALIPRFNWEQEVRLVIEIQDPKALNKALIQAGVQDPSRQIIFPMQPVNFEVAPFHCFEPDCVDQSEVLCRSGGLFNIIPNSCDVGHTLESIRKYHRDPDSEDELCDEEMGLFDAEEDEGKGILYEEEDTEGVYGAKDDGKERTIEEISGPGISKEEKNRRALEAKIKRLQDVGIGREAAMGMVQRSMGRQIISARVQARRRRLLTVSIANHTIAAANNRDVKMDLSESELFLFHRPRLSTGLKQKPWVILYNKDFSSDSVGLVKGRRKKEKKSRVYSESEKQNMSLYTGTFVCVEYIEELPPVHLNRGMASALLNYYRVAETDQEVDEDGGRDRMAGVDLSAVGAHTRVPRHVALLLNSQDQKLSDNTASTNNLPKLTFGETKSLKKEDERPFVGELAEDQMQMSLVNNLFKAPLFQHKPRSTDFLLIRIPSPAKATEDADVADVNEQTGEKSGGVASHFNTSKINPKSTCFVIRRIPALFVSGQLEPQRVVPRPNKNMTRLQDKMALLSAARYFRSIIEGVDFDTVLQKLFSFSRTKVGFKPELIKKLIRDKVAIELSTRGGRKWFLKDASNSFTQGYLSRTSTDNPADHMNAEILRQFSVEELERNLTPEEVCLQHACDSYDLRLMERGISDVELHRVKAWLDRMQKLKLYRIDRAAYLKLLSAKYTVGSIQRSNADRLFSVLTHEIQTLEERIEIGQYIYERLVFAPWNISEAYVKCIVEKEGVSKLELTGKGDPSGRGDGFAFVRLHNSTSHRKRSTEAIVGTDKDLRKLTREDMYRLLSGFGVTKEEFAQLKRWDMVQLVRSFSTKAEKAGISTNLHKYARGEMDILVVDETVRRESSQEVADSIWKRQIEVLSRVDPPVSAMLSSENYDDDDDAFDGWDEQLGISDDIERTIARRTEALEFEKRGARRQKQEEARRREDGQDLQGFKDIFRTDGGSSSAPITSSSSSSMAVPTVKFSKSSLTAADSMITQGVSSSVPELRAIYPPKVVKRVVRRVREDGTETVDIKYLLTDNEVERVRREAEKKMHQEHQTTLGSLRRDADDGIGKLLPAGSLSFKLKLGGKKREDDEEEAFGDASRRKTTTRLSAEEEAELYKPRQGAVRAGPQVSNRLPQVTFAGKLEAELLKQWNRKEADLFRYPVGNVPGYHERIRNPISLRDILQKIGEHSIKS